MESLVEVWWGVVAWDAAWDAAWNAAWDVDAWKVEAWEVEALEVALEVWSATQLDKLLGKRIALTNRTHEDFGRPRTAYVRRDRVDWCGAEQFWG